MLLTGANLVFQLPQQTPPPVDPTSLSTLLHFRLNFIPTMLKINVLFEILQLFKSSYLNNTSESTTSHQQQKQGQFTTNFDTSYNLLVVQGGPKQDHFQKLVTHAYDDTDKAIHASKCPVVYLE